MQTIKTAVVVALLLAVCYGAFVALNAPDPELPDSIREWASEQLELEDLVEIDIGSELASMDSAVPVSPDALFTGSPSQASAAAQANAAQPGNGARIGQSMGPAVPGSPPSLNPPQLSPPALAPGTSIPANFPSGADSAATQNATDSRVPALQVSSAASGIGGNNLSSLAPGESSLPNLDGIPQLGSFPALETPVTANSLVSSNTGHPIPEFELATSKASQASGNVADAVGQALPHVAPALKFSVAREQSLTMANQGELREALEMLTPYYQSPELGSDEHKDLVDLLDALSREVIYSPRHLLLPAHVCKPADTVASVAEQYKMSPELLNAVNSLGDSKAILPGSKLKVIPGPVNATVSLSNKELTLFVGQLYAGRFPISIGSDPSPKEGAFEVVDRQTNRTYYGTGAVVLQASDPRNPYGGFWLNLGDDLCIHGTPEMASSDLENAGCLSLAPLDAKHVYAILTVGSQVTITH